MFRLAGLLIVASALASAQNQFLLRVQLQDNVQQIANGGTLSVSSPALGTPRSLQLLVTYIGSTSASFPNGSVVVGSPSFSTRSVSGGPTLQPFQTAVFEITFTPAGPNPALAQFDLIFVEAAPPPSTPEAPPVAPARGLITLTLSGGIPVFALNYRVGTSGNTIPLQPNGQVAFPETRVNSSSSALVTLINQGAGSGLVQSVVVTGSAFSSTSLPPLPAGLASGAGFQFEVVYLPRQAGVDTGTLTITSEGGASQTFQLTGRGLTSQLSYELLRPGVGAIPIAPGEAIQFPVTSVGESASLQIRFSNSSRSDVTLQGISTTGPPFALSQGPLFPLTLAPEASATIDLTFNPTQPGPQAGSIRIGADTFALAGDALGPLLSYSYRASAGAVVSPVQPQGVVTFPAAAVGRSSSVQFIVQNRGTAPAGLSSIGISTGGDLFRVSGLPPLPLRLQPDASVTFTLQFLPNNTGFATGAVLIDSTPFSLSGLGEGATPLPDYSIGGPSQVSALEQPAISLTLSQSYPIRVDGVLTLLVASPHPVDPAVQFSTGGRTVAFTIPANSTRAMFTNGSPEIQMQTGSAAGTFTLTPSFATLGGLNLTPTSPAALRFSLPAAPPKLLGIQLVEQAATTLSFRLLGVTNTRSLDKMNVRFTAAPGFVVPSLDFVLDLAGSSAGWFNSATSQAFGGQFTMDIQFRLATSDRTTTAIPPVEALQAVAVTLSSSAGSSNSVTLNLR